MREIKSLKTLCFLHLMPGLWTCLGYLWFLSLPKLNGYPKVLCLSLAVICFLLPFEIGVLLWFSWKETGKLRVQSVLGFNQKMGGLNLLGYTVGLFLVTGLLMTLLKPVTQNCINYIWSDVFPILALDSNLSNYSNGLVKVTIILEFLALTLLGPWVEELYFRGLLLSRMKWMGYIGVILNTFLFALYHMWSPWLIVARTIAMLPLYTVVYKKNNITLAVLVHMLCNSTDVIAQVMQWW